MDEEDIMEQAEKRLMDLLDELRKNLNYDDYEYMIAKFRGILERTK